MALVLTLLVTAVGQSFTSVPMIFAQPRYYGEFSDSGALRAGDKVRIAGMDVGTVQKLTLAIGHVVVRFTLDGNTIGTASRLSIRTDTILGRKVLEVEPRGDEPLSPGATLPLSQTTTPYQIYDAFRDATKDAAGWDVGTIKQSLQVLTDTVDQTAPHLSAALDGVQRFADTVSKRDGQIQHLLGETSKVAGVLGIHGEQINRPRPGHRNPAVQRQIGRRSGPGAAQRQPQPEHRAQAGQHHQRGAGQAKGRFGHHGHRSRQVRGFPVRDRVVGALRQGGDIQSAALPGAATVRRLGIQEARH
jgi:MlaD protein